MSDAPEAPLTQVTPCGGCAVGRPNREHCEGKLWRVPREER